MRARKKAEENRIKMTITLDKEVRKKLGRFVEDAENPKINHSSVIEDVLDYVFNDKSEILNELFPDDKRFKKK